MMNVPNRLATISGRLAARRVAESTRNRLTRNRTPAITENRFATTRMNPAIDTRLAFDNKPANGAKRKVSTATQYSAILMFRARGRPSGKINARCNRAASASALNARYTKNRLDSTPACIGSIVPPQWIPPPTAKTRKTAVHRPGRTRNAPTPQTRCSAPSRVRGKWIASGMITMEEGHTGAAARQSMTMTTAAGTQLRRNGLGKTLSWITNGSVCKDSANCSGFST